MAVFQNRPFPSAARGDGSKNKINKIIKKSSPYSAVFLRYGSEQAARLLSRRGVFVYFFFFNRFPPVAVAVNIVGTFKRARYGQGFGGGEMAADGGGGGGTLLATIIHIRARGETRPTGRRRRRQGGNPINHSSAGPLIPSRLPRHDLGRDMM